MLNFPLVFVLCSTGLLQGREQAAYEHCNPRETYQESASYVRLHLGSERFDLCAKTLELLTDESGAGIVFRSIDLCGGSLVGRFRK
jgi:hypothetical protein